MLSGEGAVYDGFGLPGDGFLVAAEVEAPAIPDYEGMQEEDLASLDAEGLEGGRH